MRSMWLILLFALGTWGCSSGEPIELSGSRLVWEGEAFVGLDRDGSLRRTVDGSRWSDVDKPSPVAAQFGLCPLEAGCLTGVVEADDSSFLWNMIRLEPIASVDSTTVYAGWTSTLPFKDESGELTPALRRWIVDTFACDELVGRDLTRRSGGLWISVNCDGELVEFSTRDLPGLDGVALARIGRAERMSGLYVYEGADLLREFAGATFGSTVPGLERTAATSSRAYFVDDGALRAIDGRGETEVIDGVPGGVGWVAAGARNVVVAACDVEDVRCALRVSNDDGATWSSSIPFEDLQFLSAGPSGFAASTELADGSSLVSFFGPEGDKLFDHVVDAFELEAMAVGDEALLLVGLAQDGEVATDLVSLG